MEERNCTGNGSLSNKSNQQWGPADLGESTIQWVYFQYRPLFYPSYVVLQNTKEKFDKEPEECDQKELYKLLVSPFFSLSTMRIHSLDILFRTFEWFPTVGFMFLHMLINRGQTYLKPRMLSCWSSTSVTFPCLKSTSSSVASAASSNSVWWRSSKFLRRSDTLSSHLHSVAVNRLYA